MVHLNMTHGHGHHGEVHKIDNPPHQHAFTVVGDKTLFAVHMTQYHCEVHKYQLIYQFELKDKKHHERLSELRRTYPDDGFVLCNHEADPARGIDLMTVPDLASGARPTFLGNIYQGLRPVEWAELANPDFFPWSSTRCEPAIAGVEVEIKRVVLFRPFSHGDERPAHPSFVIWGKDDEFHMTNIQTAERASSAVDAPIYGPDFDMVLSLAETPDWVTVPLLEAGIRASAADIDLYDLDHFPKGVAFEKGAPVRMLYRGVGDAHTVTAGPTFLSATFVCNSPEVDPFKGEMNWYMSEMPRKYWTRM
jgi:hypothetical protein